MYVVQFFLTDVPKFEKKSTCKFLRKLRFTEVPKKGHFYAKITVSN